MATTDGSVLVTGALGCIGAWTVRELRTLERRGRLDPEEHALTIVDGTAVDAPARRASAAP